MSRFAAVSVTRGSGLAALLAACSLAAMLLAARPVGSTQEYRRSSAIGEPSFSPPGAPAHPAVPPLAWLAQAAASAAPGNHPDWRVIELHRHGAVGASVAVTVGIPFPPGMLRDARDVRIEDAHGAPIPADVQPTLYWHFAHGGIRAVRAQFHATLDGDHGTVRFRIAPPAAGREAATAKGWPYADGLVMGSEGVRVPGVLATLSPQWMSASLIAGPQQASTTASPYDRYFAAQFAWAKALPRDDGSAWLFDRPTTLFQQYVRTGRADYLAAAEASYRFYMEHIKRSGAPGWPQCGGGFHLGKVDACDPKYIYIEPSLLALGLSGDDSETNSALIQLMVAAWDSGGWNIPAGPYTGLKQRFFTEREAGLGLLQIVSAWEITGDPRYLRGIDDRVGWLYQHQRHNPDGLGNDGSWRNSWDMHEGNSYDAATDTVGSSPWMSQNIIDGLWHAWLVTGDARIPAMITAFGRYLERYGWIDEKTLRSSGKDWRDPCDGASGQISWYWSSAHADLKQLVAIENSDGWYSDSHNVELTLPVAAARYFETDPRWQRALERRMELLQSSYSESCARNSSTPRRFNWNNRGTGVVQWLMRQPAGSGAARATPAGGGG
ncbi:MAG: hypothetical protein KGM46_03505 [Pseudomonadota bacterium]|jgi:hypothetical protein|nr:hypothetical protein [Xanthomonadaceae bacterium]MDE3209784.1 hypothetical protein [Pseudomonadota bacterium]